MIVDIDVYPFDFTEFFLGTDTIASITVAATPSGLVEVVGQRVASGLVQYISIDAGLATLGILYTLACQAISSSGRMRIKVVYHIP